MSYKLTDDEKRTLAQLKRDAAKPVKTVAKPMSKGKADFPLGIVEGEDPPPP